MEFTAFIEPVQALRVLMVEDSETDAALLGRELDALGSSVYMRRVDSEPDMRDALVREPWDIIISDEAMPGFSSRQALRVLRDSGKDIPFIIYSGHMDDSMAESAMREGADDCVSKGQLGRLLPSIRRELRNVAARRAQHQAEQHVFRLAYFDALTELPNRHLFLDRVKQALEQAEGAGGSIYFMGLDYFRRINDTFGFGVGDALIRQIALRLRDYLGADVLVARIVGDGFAIHAPGVVGEAEAALHGRRILEHACTQPFVHAQLEFFVNATMGVSRYPGDGDEIEALLKNAESAMAYAKRHGRGTVHLYDHNLSVASARRFELEAALRRAVERDELVLYYQPVVHIASDRIVGVEALLRWRHPELGLLTPDRFIPLADETGMIIDIGNWVLREACRQVGLWDAQGLAALTIAVNVSAVQFAQSNFPAQVANVLLETGFDAHRLELEITESVLMRDADGAIAALRALKSTGIRISVDDFGTGYSSLAYLRLFPIDILKIDKSFMHDIREGAGSPIIVAIAALAHSLQLSTQAEGVETADQLAFLRQLECDRMQGYLCSHPLPAAELALFLRLDALRARAVSAV